MPGLQLAHHLCGARAGIFDVLRFVQHHDVPLRLQPALFVALQQRVGRNDDVVFGHGVGHFVPVFAVDHQAAQPGAKALRLTPPVAHQAHGRNDQRRLRQATGVFFNLDVGQRL